MSRSWSRDTDTDGSADLNWDLSVSRASSVVKILTREGVPPKKYPQPAGRFTSLFQVMIQPKERRATAGWRLFWLPNWRRSCR
ncbi:MAG: OmpA family protein [Saprospiraceae bacterium]|nr:OmpA family protein [Saprospiraceae bacterium]